MAGIVVCHGSAAVRDRIVAAANGVPSLAPARGAATAEELVALARRSAPALVLLDAHLPGAGPIEAMRRLRMVGVHPVVIMLAVPGDEITLDRAIALGARGYLAPDVERSELVAVAAHSLAAALVPQQPGPPGRADAVRHETGTRSDVASGDGPRSEGARSEGAHPDGAHPDGARPERAASDGARPSAPGPRTSSAPAVDLTRRELEVLAGMSHGRSNAQIGAELYLSEDTVKTHARRLFRKLGAADRAQAVAIGLRAGLIR